MSYCRHCPHCNPERSREAQADRLPAELERLREKCRNQLSPDGMYIYRDTVSMLVQRDADTLSNSFWLERLPVRRYGRGGRAMYLLADVARILLEDG